MTTVIPAVAPLPWPARLLPRAADWVPACLYTGVLLDYLVLHYTTLWSAETAVLLAALAVLVASERWEFVRYGEQMPRNVGLRQLLLTMVLIATVVQIDTEGMGPFLYLILPLKAWRWFDRRAGYLMSITVTLIYTATSLYDVITLGLPLNHVASSVILFATASAFVLTISHLAQEDRRARDHAEHLLRALEQSHRELAASAAVAADVAAVAERSRVARDIHDSLGHYLTALNIQLEKALAFQRNDPEETARTLHTAKRLAHDALADVRRSVGLLRSPQAVFSLAGLIHKLATFTGGEPHVVVEIIGDEQQYTVETRLVLYRVAQEALTNVRRHAHARQAQLTLTFAANHALLALVDDGCGFTTDDPAILNDRDRPRFGLHGIRERVALLGGVVTIQSAPDRGTRVAVSVPQTRSAAAQ